MKMPTREQIKQARLRVIDKWRDKFRLWVPVNEILTTRISVGSRWHRYVIRPSSLEQARDLVRQRYMTEFAKERAS